MRNQLLCYNYTTTHKAILLTFIIYNYKPSRVWRQLLFVTPSENYWIDWLFVCIFLS